MKRGIAVMAAGVILFTAGEIWLLAGETYDGEALPERKVTFVAPMANTGYWGITAGGIRERADEYGIHVKCVGFSELDVEKQIYFPAAPFRAVPGKGGRGDAGSSGTDSAGDRREFFPWKRV